MHVNSDNGASSVVDKKYTVAMIAVGIVAGGDLLACIHKFCKLA